MQKSETVISQANCRKHFTIFCSFLTVPHASHLPLNACKITDVRQGVWGDSVRRRKMGGWGSQGGSQEACISALLPPLTPLSGPQVLHGQEKASPPASNVLTIYDAWECHCTGAGGADTAPPTGSLRAVRPWSPAQPAGPAAEVARLWRPCGRLAKGKVIWGRSQLTAPL